VQPEAEQTPRVGPSWSAVITLRRRLVLDRLYIGELDVAPGEEMEVVEYEDDLAEGQFYQVLKRRVEKYFRGNEVQSGCLLWRAALSVEQAPRHLTRRHMKWTPCKDTLHRLSRCSEDTSRWI